MYQLTGEFHCKIDAKGRLMIPSVLRKQLPLELIIKFGFEQRLELYPKPAWDNKINKIKSKLNEFNPSHRDFLRKYNLGIQSVEIDTIGRILIPKTLLNNAEIQNEIVISCMGSHMEISSKTAYESLYENLDTEAFSNLAEEILGASEGGWDE